MQTGCKYCIISLLCVEAHSNGRLVCFRENESLHWKEMSAYIHVLADDILLLCGDSGGLCHQLDGPGRRQFSHAK